MTWSVNRFPVVDPNGSSSKKKQSQQSQAISSQLAFSFPMAPVENDPLPTTLLNSSYYDSSAQSVLNYKITKSTLLVTFAVTVDTRNAIVFSSPHN